MVLGSFLRSQIQMPYFLIAPSQYKLSSLQEVTHTTVREMPLGLIKYTVVYMHIRTRTLG